MDGYFIEGRRIAGKAPTNIAGRVSKPTAKQKATAMRKKMRQRLPGFERDQAFWYPGRVFSNRQGFIVSHDVHHFPLP